MERRTRTVHRTPYARIRTEILSRWWIDAQQRHMRVGKQHQHPTIFGCSKKRAPRVVRARGTAKNIQLNNSGQRARASCGTVRRHLHTTSRSSSSSISSSGSHSTAIIQRMDGWKNQCTFFLSDDWKRRQTVYVYLSKNIQFLHWARSLFSRLNLYKMYNYRMKGNANTKMFQLWPLRLQNNDLALGVMWLQRK